MNSIATYTSVIYLHLSGVLFLNSSIKSGNGSRSGEPAGSGATEKRKETTVSSTVTVANNNKQEQNSDEGSGKRPDLGILIRGLPVRSSGMYNTQVLGGGGEVLVFLK